MLAFEEDDHEPVAVVRTLSDFALALTLVVLMLVGTRAVTDTKAAAESRAATAQAGGQHSELTLMMLGSGKFRSPSTASGARELTAAELAQQWTTAHPDTGATIVLEFAPKTLATDLHRALLDLQNAFGTHLTHIDTIPQP